MGAGVLTDPRRHGLAGKIQADVASRHDRPWRRRADAGDGDVGGGVTLEFDALIAGMAIVPELGNRGAKAVIAQHPRAEFVDDGARIAVTSSDTGKLKSRSWWLPAIGSAQCGLPRSSARHHGSLCASSPR